MILKLLIILTFLSSQKLGFPKDTIVLLLKQPPPPPPPCFTRLHQPRLSGRGGGVAVILYRVFLIYFIGFIIYYKNPAIVLIIYRAPKPNSFSIEEFAELSSHFEPKFDKILSF